MASNWFRQELKYLTLYFVISIVATAVAIVAYWIRNSEPGLTITWPACYV